MNKPAEINDLLDLFASKEISLEQLQSRLGDVNAGELNREIELHLAARRAIRKYAIIQQVANIHQEINGSGFTAKAVLPAAPAKVLGMHNAAKWVMRIAASVTLLVGLYGAQYFAFYSPSKMYARNFREYYLNTERSAVVQKENELAAAFRENDYSRVTGLYEKSAGTGNREKFLAGYAYLQQKDYEAAGTVFNEIIVSNSQSGSTYFQDEAEYYLAMTKLQQGDTDAALSLMNKIYNSKGHTFHESVTRWMIFRLKWY